MTDLTRLFRYDDWANHEEVARLRQRPDTAALRILGHIIGAEWLWYARLRGEEPRVAVWPELSPDDCLRSLDLLGSFWTEYLADASLDSAIAYVNSKGESRKSRVDDVLMHVVLHGSYHRGQIAIVLRAGGEDPPYTDYIHCTRSGLI